MTSLYVKCDGCGKTLGMEQVWPNEPPPHWTDRWRFLRDLLALGWTEKGDDHRCPECSNGAPQTRAAPCENPPAQVRGNR